MSDIRHTNKPFSQACENNKAVILTQLQQWFANSSSVLEIGSGTGQHATYFASSLPFLRWQCSDQPQNHQGINQWIDDFPAANLLRPISFTLGEDNWPTGDFDAVFTANTAHIMQKHEVKQLMQQIAKHLPKHGVFCQYGPFTEQGTFSTESNHNFHKHLIAEGYGGYRDIEELEAWADGLQLMHKIPMPANNLLLVWLK